MTETILQSKDQQDFLALVDEKRASTWQCAPGIEFVCRQESVGWGLALYIERQMQRPNLFSETLKRRFENAQSYEGCCICLDSQLTFVIWHGLAGDYQREQICEVGRQLLTLAGLRRDL